MTDDGLVYVGKIISLYPIPEADFIVSATVICGKGGRWRGVVRKADFSLGDKCLVFLPDSLLNEKDHAHLSFMEKTNWRVKMCRFKGCPSEVLISTGRNIDFLEVGTDVTRQLNVVKYHKPIPPNLAGVMKGTFPYFIPKTDELNYQKYPEIVESLIGKPWYMTEKMDGSSSTAFKWKGSFGVCSRNMELERDENNGYWIVALKHNLEEKLPDGIAIQWETCGPGIQKNPMDLSNIQGFMFSAYDISKQRYLEVHSMIKLSEEIDFPMVKILDREEEFSSDGIDTLGEGFYANGNPREGVVIRSIFNEGDSPISFKVINLEYEN